MLSVKDDSNYDAYKTQIKNFRPRNLVKCVGCKCYSGTTHECL
jgi:hypothetical protein